MKVNKLITSLDFLAAPKNFSINNKITFKTFIGGFLSILICISSIILFLITGDDFIHKTNPNGYSSIIEDENTFQLVTNFEFFIGIQMINIDEEILDLDEYLYPLFKITNNTFLDDGSIIGDHIIIPTIPCDKFNFGKRVNTHNFPLSKFICPDISKIKNTTIGGDFYQMQNSTELVFHLSLCDHNDENCKDPNKFKELTQDTSILLNILYPEVIYRIDDYQNPFKIDLRLDRTFINYYTYVWYDMAFSNFKLNENTGNILQSKKEDSVLGPSGIIRLSDIKHFQPNQNMSNQINKTMNYKEMNFLVIFISKNNKMQFYHRSYLAFSTVLANVASLVKTIMAVLTFVYLYFNKIKIDSHLCSRLLFFEDDEDLDFNEKELELSNTKKNQINQEFINFSNLKLNNKEDNSN
jgi:hypothetical protein